MTLPESETSRSPQLAAEAAAWMALLHGPNRTRHVEKSFADWLKTSPEHARVFEEMTEIWDTSRALPMQASPSVRQPRMTWQTGLAVAAALVVCVVGMLLYQRHSPIATAIGEQRLLTLEDGTRVMLNTGTRVRIDYDDQRRAVELTNGEALFEVAKQPERPFIVTAGERTVTALGTQFVVRRDDQQIAVTLLEGKVIVAPLTNNPSIQPTTLAPGERLTFNSSEVETVDRPDPLKILAWRRYEVSFDRTSLPEAIAEMNRYSSKPLQLESEAATKLQVTGLFRAGESLSFAQAVAAAYRMQAREETDRIVLEERHPSD